MRNFNILPSLGLFVVALFVACSGPGLALAKDESEGKKEVPPWMEEVDGGKRGTYLVPKGAKVEKVTDSHVIVEPPNEYAARRFFEIDKRQDDIEKELKEIKSALEELREQCALQQQSSSEKAP